MKRLSVPAAVAAAVALAVLDGGVAALRVSASVSVVLAAVVVAARPRASPPLAVAGACLGSLYASWWVWAHLPYGFLDARTDGSGLLLWSSIEIVALASLAMSIGRAGRPGALALSAALVAVAGFVTMRLVPREELGVRAFIAGLCAAVVAAAWALGRYLRSLDRSRELAVAAARREQRRSLALDLHDFVAHEITAIAVEAQATLLIGGDAASESLVRIEAAAGRALDSLDRSIDVLTGDDESRLRAYTPGLADLDKLLGEFDRPVELTSRLADPGSIPPGVQATAYRVVLEGLANIRHHAPTDANVAVTMSDSGGELVVSVWNRSGAGTGDGSPSTAHAPHDLLLPRRRRTGLGLVGLRERVEALGGTLVAGSHDDGDAWLLQARIPTV